MENRELIENLNSYKRLESFAWDNYLSLKKERETFEKENHQQLEEIRIAEWKKEKAEKAEAAMVKAAMNKKIYDYITVDMWIKVKTRAGNVWQKVVYKKESFGYYTVKCNRPERNSGIITYNKNTKKYSIGLFQEHQVDRSDGYAPNSILAVLVSDGNGFYEEKSFRKDIFGK